MREGNLGCCSFLPGAPAWHRWTRIHSGPWTISIFVLFFVFFNGMGQSLQRLQKKQYRCLCFVSAHFLAEQVPKSPLGMPQMEEGRTEKGRKCPAQGYSAQGPAMPLPQKVTFQPLSPRGHQRAHLSHNLKNLKEDLIHQTSTGLRRPVSLPLFKTLFSQLSVLPPSWPTELRMQCPRGLQGACRPCPTEVLGYFPQ